MCKQNIKHSIFVALLMAAAPIAASATVIVAQTVPWLPSSPTTPHRTWNGNSTTLKGVSNVADGGGNTIVYDWNPGDGGPHCTGTVTNAQIIECAHTYSGQAIGNTLNATLTVYDNTTGSGSPVVYSNSSTSSYYVKIYAPPPNLQVEVDAAIDAGLWFLHKSNYPVTGGGLTLNVTNEGQNYALHYSNGGYYESVSFTVSGDGSGASVCGDAVTNPSDANYGKITNAYICAQGSGYTTGTVTATDNYCGYKPGIYAGQQCGSGFAATLSVTPYVYGNTVNWWGTSYAGSIANNCNAFEVSGHLESGPSTDPYTADVHACLQKVFSYLTTVNIGTGTKSNGHGNYTPDSNGNGYGVHENDGNSQDQYQSGMMVDVITASGTPDAQVTTGPLASLSAPSGGYPHTGAAPSHPGYYTYKDAVVDMIDYDVYCAGTNNPSSWHYSCNPSDGDNSVAQWVAIGMVSGIRDFGAIISNNVRLGNEDWLNYSQTTGFSGGGYFGYTSNSGIGWGPYAETPAGMVQLAMDGLGRSPTATLANNASATKWDWAETFMRDNFDIPQTGSASNDVKDYYYGLFSFTKSMLLHDNSGTGTSPTPIQMLRSLDNGAKPDIDWYAAQDATFGGSDTSNGVARTLVSGTPANNIKGQLANGSWAGHDYTSTTSEFNTAWAIIMLNRTVTQIQPNACISPLSPTGANNTSISISGNCSGTTDPNKTITTWQWDTSCTAGGGTNFTSSGVNLNHVFVNPNDPSGYPYSCPVRLRVTDSGGLTADLVFNVTVTVPGGVVAPVANVGGPYSFCKNITPWYFDGSQSSQSAPATITSYAWDYTCSNTFTSSSAIQPRVDTGANNIFSEAAGSYCVALKLTNNYSLTSVQTNTYVLHAATETQCTDCVTNIVPKVKNSAPGSPGSVQLYWNDTNSANLPVTHYNVYRSSNSDFSNFIVVAGQGGTFPAVPVPTVHGAQVVFIDTTAAKAATYYYRISPATSNDSATCSSPLTTAATVGGR